MTSFHVRTFPPIVSTTSVFPCPYCDTTFCHRSTFDRHLNHHTKHKPYRCTHQQCTKRFTQIGSRIRHQKICNYQLIPYKPNVKKYICDICNTNFEYRKDLHKHLYTKHHQMTLSIIWNNTVQQMKQCLQQYIVQTRSNVHVPDVPPPIVHSTPVFIPPNVSSSTMKSAHGLNSNRHPLDTPIKSIRSTRKSSISIPLVPAISTLAITPVPIVPESSRNIIVSTLTHLPSETLTLHHLIYPNDPSKVINCRSMVYQVKSVIRSSRDSTVITPFVSLTKNTPIHPSSCISIHTKYAYKVPNPWNLQTTKQEIHREATRFLQLQQTSAAPYIRHVIGAYGDGAVYEWVYHALTDTYHTKYKIHLQHIQQNLKPMLIRMTQCVHALHSNDTVHKDLKPNNFFFSRSDFELSSLVVGDFGLSGCLSDLLRRNTVRRSYHSQKLGGTAAYRAPCYWSDNLYNETNELWAIGVMMVEIGIGNTMQQFIRQRYKADSLLDPNTITINVRKHILEHTYIQWKQFQQLYSNQCVHILQQITQEQTPYCKNTTQLLQLLEQTPDHIFQRIQHIDTNKDKTNM